MVKKMFFDLLLLPPLISTGFRLSDNDNLPQSAHFKRLNACVLLCKRGEHVQPSMAPSIEKNDAMPAVAVT